MNDGLWEGHTERMRGWIESNPRIDPKRKQVMFSLVDRQQKEQALFERWMATLAEAAPDRYVPFAQDALARAVPHFERYDLAL